MEIHQYNLSLSTDNLPSEQELDQCQHIVLEDEEAEWDLDCLDELVHTVCVK